MPPWPQPLSSVPDPWSSLWKEQKSSRRTCLGSILMYVSFRADVIYLHTWGRISKAGRRIANIPEGPAILLRNTTKHQCYSIVLFFWPLFPSSLWFLPNTSIGHIQPEARGQESQAMWPREVADAGSQGQVEKGGEWLWWLCKRRRARINNRRKWKITQKPALQR